jgi:hypothetical protein
MEEPKVGTALANASAVRMSLWHVDACAEARLERKEEHGNVVREAFG